MKSKPKRTVEMTLSNAKINQLGERLRLQAQSSSPQGSEDLEMLDSFRKMHSDIDDLVFNCLSITLKEQRGEPSDYQTQA